MLPADAPLVAGVNKPERRWRRTLILFATVATTLSLGAFGVKTTMLRRATRSYAELMGVDEAHDDQPMGVRNADDDDIEYCTCAGDEAYLARSGCCAGAWASQEECYWHATASELRLAPSRE